MMEAQTFIINTPELFQRLKTYQQKLNSPYTCLDTETNSKIEKLALLWGIGLCFNDLKAFYIVWRDKAGNKIWTEQQEKDIIEWLLNTCKNTKVIGHNLLYDILVLENNININITDYLYHDTILSKHTLDEERPFGLKEIAVKELGEWADQAQNDLKDSVIASGGRWSKEDKDIYLGDTDILGKYCCWDVLLTYKLFQIFDVRLTNENLTKLFYEDEVMPLYKLVTIDMKRKGFPIDVAYYENLKKELTQKINEIEDEIQNDIAEHVEDFNRDLLNEEFPINNAGNFPKALADILGAPLPINNKTGKITLSAKAIAAQKKASAQFEYFYNWIEGKVLVGVDAETLHKAQKKLFFDKKPDQRYVFNLRSNDHLAHLICTVWGNKPLEKTEKEGKPKIDDDFLEFLKDSNDIIAKLLDYKKLNKLLSTYVDGILDRQIGSFIYTSMLQFGTTSGRFSSVDPNLQNQPRIKDEDSGLSPLVLHYVNAIRGGFIAPKGFKIVNADYSSLEPVCFAHVSNEQKLRDVFTNGEDLYSRIAIDVYELTDVSANKKASNYLKNVYPELRQKAKVFCLAVVYGAEEKRIQDVMKCSWTEAHNIIKAYLKAYPELKKYMTRCNIEAKNKGFVSTEFGRIRHLQKAQILNNLYGNDIIDYKWAKRKNLLKERREFKNLLNNAKNFKIQGLASHIVNRAMIATRKAFYKNNINGYIGLSIHDEITCVVKEEQAAQAAKILQYCMENTTNISVTLSAVPIIADNWGDAK